MKRTLYIILAIFLLARPVCALDIIPDLKGFGTDTRAAYGAANDPEICVVTSTAETTGVPSWDTVTYPADVYTGTLIQCLEYLDCETGGPVDGHTISANSGKVIVFDTSGVIANSGSQDRYTVNEPYTTIAGQTALSPGVWLRNIRFEVRDHDVLVQHITSAAGDEDDGEPAATRNSLMVLFPSTSGSTYNVVVDHVSALWGVDTGLTIYGDASRNVHDITVSNCLVAEGLHESIHDAPHSKGLALQTNSTNTSALYNLVLSNYDRNPYVRWGTHVCVNNYTYNHGITGMLVLANAGTQKLAAVGNVVEEGPDSTGGGMAVYFATLHNDPTYATNWDNSEIYFLANRFIEADGTAYTQSDSEDWTTTAHIVNNYFSDNMAPYKVTGETPADDAPLWPTGLVPLAVGDVKAYVTANAGSRPGDRDTVNTRIVGDLTNDTGDLIDTVELVCGDCTAVDDPMWCCTELDGCTCDRNDGAGSPTFAENSGGLATMPTSPHADDDSDGYTNIEEWLHDFAALVEGKSIDPQNVSPTDGGTGVSTTATASCYNSDYVTTWDIWLDKGTCAAEAGTTLVSDDDADGSYDMSTLDESSTYCLVIAANYNDEDGNPTQGDAEEYEFATTDELPQTSPGNLLPIVITAGGAPITIDSGGAPIVLNK